MALPKTFEEVTQADLETILGGLTEPSFSYTGLFPAEFTSNLSWEVLEGSGNMTVAADVVAHDSSVGLKGRPDAAIMTGEIQKVGLLAKVGEKQLHNLYALQNGPRGIADQIYSIIFGDIARVYRGVHARMEMMAMEALSSGVITTASNNTGIDITATFNIPADNKTGATAVWTDVANATPIADLKERVRYARAQGYRIQQIVMDQATVDNLIATNEVKAMFSARIGLSNSLINPTVEEVNTLMSAESLPNILVVDPAVPVEAENGTTSIVDPWSAGKVAFLSSATAGTTQWTFTAEEKSAGFSDPASLSANRDIVRVTRFGKVNPYRVFTKGEAVAIPVLANPKSIFLLNSLNASTWS